MPSKQKDSTGRIYLPSLVAPGECHAEVTSTSSTPSLTFHEDQNLSSGSLAHLTCAPQNLQGLEAVVEKF